MSGAGTRGRVGRQCAITRPVRVHVRLPEFVAVVGEEQAVVGAGVEALELVEALGGVHRLGPPLVLLLSALVEVGDLEAYVAVSLSGGPAQVHRRLPHHQAEVGGRAWSGEHRERLRTSSEQGNKGTKGTKGW